MYSLPEYQREALDIAGVSVWKVELPSGKIRFSDLKCTILGYNPADFSNLSDFAKYLFPKEEERLMQSVNDCIEGRSDSFRFDYRLLNSKSS
jgi:hypothetical protein